MKIAFFHDLPAGGALIATNEIAKKLSKEHTLNLYQLKRKKPSYYQPEKVFNKIKTYKITLPKNKILRDLYALTKARQIQKKIADDINQENYDTVFVTHTRFFQAPWILRCLKPKTIFLCQEPTRALFEDFLKPNPEWPLLNKLYEKFLRSIRKNIEIKNAQYPQKIVANSKFSAKQIRKAYNRDAIPVYLGVNLQNFYPTNEKRKNQILVIGNNEPQKNLQLAIEAISLIKKDKRPTLVIVGPRNSNLKPLKIQAKKKKVNLKTYQNISIEKLKRLYNQSLVTLAVAINEPFGLSAVESQACGTPVIAVDEGGFKETIIDNKTGYLVARNAEKIANKTLYLIEHPHQRTKIGKAANNHIKENFTWKKTANSLQTIFNSL